jgi:hypothetical protein
MTKLRATGVLALLAFSAATCAQPNAGQPLVGGGQPMVQPPAQPAQPPFESLAKPGPDGKIQRLGGILDILALRVNPQVDAATMEKVRPLVKEWMADVDQIAIDNLDFLEKIEPLDGTPGMIDSFDISQSDKLTTIGQIMTHLMSAGPLSSYLETKGALTREQSQLNQQITSEYLQKVMNEIMAENGVPNDMNQRPQSEEERTKQVNTISRFLYELSCRDAVESYHRLLVQTAPNVDKALAAINAKADQAAVSKAKAASSDKDKRAAVREVMKSLSFDQRRALLEKGRELAGDFDPLAPASASAGGMENKTAAR